MPFKRRVFARCARFNWQATLVIALLLVVWQLLCSMDIVPAYILPSPISIITALIADFQMLANATLVTLAEAIIGLVAGAAIGYLLAFAMDGCSFVKRALLPLVTFSQTVPAIAIAPLLVLWLGYGMLPKIVLVILTTFFPVAISVYEGLAHIDVDLLQLMQTMGATRLQVIRWVKIPATRHALFSGLKIAATYAIVGSVIAEWLGGSAGLGVYMTRSRRSFAYDQMFASIVVISVLSLVLLWALSLLERLSDPYARRAQRQQRK